MFSNASDVRLTIRALDRLGITPPADAAAALAVYEAAQQAAQRRPADELGEQLLAGTLTPANVGQAIAAASTDLAAQDHAATLAQGLNWPTRQRAKIAFAAEAERILLALRPAFDEAARVVEESAKYVRPDATAAEAALNGSGALAAFERLGGALDALTGVRNIRITLADVGYGDREQSASWWIAEAEDLGAYAAAEGAMHGALGNTFHQLAHLGLTLRLNTAAEARNVRKGAAAVTDRREREREAQRIAAGKAENGWMLNAWPARTA